MDPITSIATSVVMALVPYLARAGTDLVKDVSKAAADKIGALYEVLKTQFESHPAAKEALEDLKTHPNDEDTQAALRAQLKKRLADPALKATLEKLLSDIKQDPATASFLTQVYGGEVGNIINVGTLGNLDIH